MSGVPSRTVDALLAAAGLDAADGVQIVAATRLSSVAFDPSMPLLVLRGGPPAGDPLPGRHARRGAMASLAALYPPSHAMRPLPEGAERAL